MGKELKGKAGSSALEYGMNLTDYQRERELRKYYCASTFFYEGEHTVNKNGQKNNWCQKRET